jgi:hypothetical protein
VGGGNHSDHYKFFLLPDWFLIDKGSMPVAIFKHNNNERLLLFHTNPPSKLIEV